MKRRLMALLCVLFALVGALAIATACANTSQSGDEAGEYYCDYNGAEYSLTLGQKLEFTLKIASETMEGTYTLTGEELTLSVKNGDPIAATYKENTVTLSYGNNTYTFLRKIEYTVSFDTDGGSSVAEAHVLNGRTVSCPSDPTKENKVFVGWYTDKTYKNVYHFSQPVLGNVTVYARFVDKLDPEFTVSFDANYAGAGQIDSVTTAGNMLYEAMLPTPERAGYEFVGWYVSQFRDPAKLSYAYTDQKIAENITLYAVWDEGNPVVTVSESGVEMSAKGANLTYALTITAPDGTTTTDSKALAGGTTTSFAYNFASKAEGEYKVEVVVDGKTTTRYYNNKALARVSVFKVEGTTLLFNAVEGAAEYKITVVCGIEGHAHTDVSLKTNTSYDFKTCDMRPEGIDFVVTAVAAGHVSSTSDVYTYLNRLDKVANLSVDGSTQVASWDAVEHATSYKVTVTVNGGTPTVKNVGKVTSYSLKSFAKGEVKIEVVPVAYGWNSPEAASYTYTKANNATPKNVSVENNVVSWDAVAGVSKYEVKVGTQTHTVTENSYKLTSDEVGTSAEVTVSSLGATAAETSFPSDAITVKGAGKIENIVYHEGVATWDPIFNATSYEVKLNGGDVTVVNSASAKVIFTKADTNTIEVRAIVNGAAQNEWGKLEVTAYEVELHLGGDENTVEKKYLAEGDPIDFVKPTWAGYDFESWYTAPNGPKGEGAFYRDPYFGGGKMSLYAYYTPHVYTITFVSGDMGEQVDSVEVYYRQENVVLPVAKSISDDYTFLGWYTEDGSGVKFTDEKGKMLLTYFTELRDLTLYADWVAVFKYTAVAGGWAVSAGDGLKFVSEATIPETHLGGNVVTVESFSSQTTLEILNIPNTVKAIELGSKATTFSGCTNLKAVNVYEVEDNRDPKYASKDGMVYEIEGNRLIFVPFAIGETVEIPEGIEELVAGAFYANTVVKEVHVPASVRTVQTEVFRSEGTTEGKTSSLERIYFTNNGEEGATLTIADKAFYYQRKLKSVSLPKQIADFSSASLYMCTGIEEIYVIDSVETDEYYSLDGVLFTNTKFGSSDVREVVAYPAGNPRTGYTIPAGVESVGDRAFYEAKNLTSMDIPAEIRNIGTDAFRNCMNLLTLTFGGTAESPDLTIGATAFYNCNVLAELTLPANVVSIGESAFGGTTKLTKVVVNVGRNDTSKVTFGARAFGTLTSTNPTYFVTDLTLGRYCPEVDIAGVFGNKVKTLKVDENNARISTITEGEGSGALYNADQTKILYYMGDGAEFTVPNTVEEIPDSLFRSNTKLKKINIPASVKKIGNLAFDGCTKLATVNFMDDTEEGKERDLTIGRNAFQNCTSLTSIQLPEYTSVIGGTAFANTAITSLNLPKALKDINESGEDVVSLAIYNMPQLKTLTVSDGNTHFKAINNVLYALEQRGEWNTYDPVALVYVPQNADVGNGGKVKVPETVELVFEGAARFNTSIVDLEFADRVVAYDSRGASTEGELEIYANAFYQCYSLKSVKLPEGLISLDQNVFYQCKNLKSVTIPSTVEEIRQSFAYCTGLETVTFAQPMVGTTRAALTLVDSASSPNTSSYGAFGFCSSLTSIELPEGTTKIGHSSFMGCTSLKTVKLPSTVTTIGKYAFYGLTMLDKVEFPNGIKEDGRVTIGDYAFYGTSKLSAFDFAEGVTSIGSYAFFQTGLSSVTLPSTSTTIGTYAFRYSKVKNVNMTKATKLTSIGNYAFESTELEGELVIPASVTSIGMDSFSVTKITQFTLADNSKLSTLQTTALRYTSNLEKVNFGRNSNLKTIGAQVFLGSSIRSITIPASVTTLSANAFRGATRLETITFETDSKLSMVGANAFQGTAIKEFSFPAVPAQNGSYATITLGAELFKGCTELKTVFLSPSVASVNGVFKGCMSITKVTISAGNEYLTADPSGAPVIYSKDKRVIRAVYGELPEDTLRVPDNVTTIEDGAYYGQINLKTVILPATLSSIGMSAFQGCINLTDVEIYAPDSGEAVSLTSIGDKAFDGCFKLKNFAFEAAVNLQSIGLYAFHNTAFETLDLSKNQRLTDIGEGAFQYIAIETLDLSKNTRLTNIGDSAFAYIDTLTEVKGLPSSLKSTDWSVFAYDSKLKSVDLSGSGLTSLAGSMFDHCSSLTTIQFPSGLTTIGNSAFAYCEALEEMDLSRCTQLTRIGSESGSYVFSGCTNLHTVKFPSSVTFIGSHSFEGCTSLTKVDLSNTSITALHTKYAKPTSVTISTANDTCLFSGCINLKEVVLPEACFYIGNKTFQGCTALETIDISHVSMFGQYAFDNTGLTEVTVPSVMTGTSSSSFGQYVFSNCAQLTKVTIPDEVAYLGMYTFRNCHQLKTVVFGANSNMGTISGSLFEGDEKLESINLPRSATTIGSSAFSGCASLHDIDLQYVTSIGDYAFEGTGIRSLYLHDGLNKTGKLSIGASAFMDCLELKEITIAPEVKSLYSSLFKGCTALEKVTFEDGSQLQVIYSSIFEGCSKLTDVIFEGEMSAFEGYYSTAYSAAFRDCTSLEHIDLSKLTNEAFISLNKNTFMGCVKLTTVKLPAQIVNLGESTFAGCTSLASIEFPERAAAIGAYCFKNTGFTTFEIPYNITKIGAGAFAECEKLTRFVPQADADGHTHFTASADGAVLYDDSGMLIASVPNVDWEAEEAEFTAIGGGAFEGVHGISDLVLPEGLVSIGDYAFRGSDVENLIVPASVMQIDTYAFAGSGIKSIVFLGSAEALNVSGPLFDGCTSLVSVTFPEGLTTIVDYMFYGCSNLEHVEIPSSVTMIGSYAFLGTPLAEAKLENVTEIGESAFEGTRLTEVVLPKTLTTLGDYAFQNIEPLEEVTIEGALINSANSVGVFQECKNLTTVVIESGLQVVGESWFFHDLKLKDVTLPDTVTQIKDYAFAMYTEADNLGSVGAITEIELPARITTLGTGILIGSSITQFAYPRGFAKTGSYTFHGVETLKYVKISSTIGTVDSYTFNNCTGLEYVVMEEGGSATLSGAVFYGCTNLRFVDLADSTVTLNERCFANCEKLRIFLKPTIVACYTTTFYDEKDAGTIAKAPNMYFALSQAEVVAVFGADMMNFGEHLHFNATRETVLNDLETKDGWTIPTIEW